jgi:nitroreductase
MNEVVRAILDRRSNRGFSAEPLTREEVDTFAQVALASPTARNLQRWHFSFVTDTGLLQRCSDAFRACAMAQLPESARGRFANSGFNVFFHAPLVVFISLPRGEENSPFALIDCGIAAENLAIAAQGMGMGSVIVGMPRDFLNSDAGAQWRAALGFPEDNVFAICVVIGHGPAQKEAHPVGEGKISFIR